MDKRRMYYFDGQSILLNETGSKSPEKFDQNYDELNATDVLRRSNPNNMTQTQNYNQTQNPNNNSNIQNISSTNFQNFMMSGENQDEQNQPEYGQYYDYNNSPDYKSQTGNFSEGNFNLNQTQYQNNLLSEELINSLKDQYYKTKGYIENKPDILMEFVLDYKNFEKRGLKVPSRMQPFIPCPNEDIYYSLTFYHNQFMASQQRTKSNNTSLGRFKTKFTKDTLKRLYPMLKTDEEMQKLRSSENRPETMEKFVEKLVFTFLQENKEFTNDENRLYDFWLAMEPEDREKNCLKWDMGEKNMEVHLIDFFSEEKTIKRLSKVFQNVCGYECYHPRPLHDYWVKQIPNETKYFKGLFKYDSDTLYRIMEDYYIKKKEEDKKAEEEQITQSKREEELKKQKNKVTSKEEYEKLKKKFENLSKPKDKWRTGRAMINLRKYFQYDNVIQKMIKYEFQENRVFKFPEEYALYDEENSRKTMFKNSLEKKIKKEDEDKIREMLQRTKFDDESKKRGEEHQMQEIYKEDMNLDKFLKKMCIQYYRNAEARLSTGKTVSINNFLTGMYQMMLKSHAKSTRRRFPKMKNYGKIKKSRFSNYPITLKYYFFNLYRRLGINQDGKFIFANYDNMPFWAPSLSNKCKIHSNNCPIYCKNNTHNDIIHTQRSKNFNILYNLDDHKLEPDERLNMWKRKDEEILEQKKKIFLCFSEAEHCTFEPKINKKEDEMRNLTNEEIVNKRLSNKMWVNNMGDNFSSRFPLVYKEGICKKAARYFQEGKFTNGLKILEEAFDLDSVKANFDPKFAVIYKKKLEEEKKKNQENPMMKTDIYEQLNAGVGKKKVPEKDDFNNPKNYQICMEVYSMIKLVDDFKKSKQKEIKKLEKELKIVQDTKKEIKAGQFNNNCNSNSVNLNMNNPLSYETLKVNYIKDRYFKFFKTLMCPLKNECAFDIRPRWPHSDLKANAPFGQGCPYAHHISEIKFEQEVKQKLILKSKVLKELQKDFDPCINNEWIPAGPIVSCNGCGKTYSEKSGQKGGGERVGAAGGPKGLCGFCRYRQKNEIELIKDKKMAEMANKEILKKINYENMKKAEEWDQDYVAKFGMLKKASVLYSFRRYTDSLAIMEKLKSIVESEQTSNDDKFLSLDKKWRAKLKILDYEIPKDVLNYEINQEVIDYFNIKVPLSTLLVYVEKMRKGNSFSIYNRHTFLNNQILQFFQTVKKTLEKYKVDVRHLTKQMSELNLWSEKKDKLKNENKELYNKFYKKYRAEMCPNVVNGRKCPESYRDCKFAHHPSQLNLTLVDKQKKLLKNTLNETKKKMKKSSTLVPWSYPKQKVYEQGLKFDKTLVARYSVVNKLRSKSEKRNKSVDINKLRIKFHEI